MSADQSYDEFRAEFDDLLLRARLGDQNALAEAINTLKPVIHCMIRRTLRLLPDEELQLLERNRPSDVFQDACFEALRDFPNFKGQTHGEFVGWILRIVMHTCSDGRKLLVAKKRSPAREHPLADPLWRAEAEALADPRPGPEELADEQQQTDDLHRAMQALPPGERELLERRYLQEQSWAEVAAWRHKPVEAVRKACARALKHLARLLRVS